MENQLTFGDLLLTRTGHFNFTAADKQKWLIESVWASRGIGIISGEPKIGKTTLVQELAVCVATGLPFLGKFQVHAHGPVMFSSPEGSTHELDERFRQICGNKKVDQKNLDLYIVTKQRIHLNNPHDQETIQKAVAALAPALIVFDPFKNHFNGNENDTSAASEVTNFLTALSNEFRCAVMLTHHQVKSTSGSKSDGSRIRGSGALFGFGDSYLFLNKDKRGRIVMSNEQRHAAPIPPIPLRLKTSGNFFIDASDRTEKKVEPHDKILALLRKDKKRWIMEDIRASIGMKYATTSAAVALLARDGIIHKHPKGGYTLEKPKIKPKKDKPSHSSATGSTPGGMVEKKEAKNETKK